MKKKMLLVITACAVLGLASCNRAVSSSASETPVSSASSSSVDSTVYATDLTLDSSAVTLKVEETHAIVATVSPAGVTTKGVTFVSDNTGVATVSAEGLITAVKAGTANITVSTKSLRSSGGAAISKTVVVTVNMKTISDITKAGTYDVKGVVAAKTTKGFLLHDGTAGVYVYLGTTPTYDVGDYLEVSETLKDSSTRPYQPYNSFYQFTEAATITVLSGAGPTLPEAVDLTKTTADGWATATSFAPTAIQKYKWTTYAKASGSYTTINLEGSDTLIENSSTLDALKPVAGNKYEIEGYLFGYSVGTTPYAAIAVTKLTQVYDDVSSITVSAAGDATWTRVGETLQLTATIAPVTGNPKVTWKSSDESKATIDQTGKITGVAAATGIVFTATSDVDNTKSGSVTIAIHEANANPVTGLAIKEGTVWDLPVSCPHTFGASVLPAEANQNVVWTSSDPTVATVDPATGVAMPLKAGETTLTATTVGKDATDTVMTASLKLTVATDPTTEDIAVADLMAKGKTMPFGVSSSDNERYYKFTGILEKSSFVNGSSGTAYVTDPISQVSIKLKGVTDSTNGSGSFAYATDSQGIGQITYSDRKLAATDLAGYANGEKVTFIGQLLRNFNGDVYSCGYFTEHQAVTDKYTASVSVNGHGTAALDVSTDIVFNGDLLIVRTTPESDSYEIKGVYSIDGYGVKTILTVSSMNANVWSCQPGVVNHFVAEFGPAVDTSVTLDAFTLNVTETGYLNGGNAVKLTGTWIGLAFKSVANMGYGLQLNPNPSFFYNTTALPGYIKKVTINWNAKNTSTKKAFKFVAGNTSAMTAATTDTNNLFGTETTTFDVPASQQYTYFQFCHVDSVQDTFYIDSVVIDFDPIA